MFLSILLALLLGIGLGTVTGLIPGIHANLVATVALSILASVSLGPVPVLIFFVSLGMTHSLLDVIPSIFLGAPDPSTVLSVLPGHKLLQRGFGYEAVKLALCGSLLGSIVALVLTPAIFFGFRLVQQWVQPWLHWLLGVALVWSVWKEPTTSQRFWAGFVVVMSGMLGLVVLPAVREPLFPMLSGLFGASALLLSLNGNAVAPVQRVTDMLRLPKFGWVQAVGAGVLAGVLGAFLPGLGPAHTAAIAALLVPAKSVLGYLVLTGALGTANFFVSLVTVASIGKARNGVIAAASELVVIDVQLMLVLLFAGITVAALTVLFGLRLCRVVLVVFEKVPYQKLAISVLLLLTVLSLVLSGPLGILVLVVATAIGVLPGLLGIAHHHGMGCLLIPVFLYFLG